MEKIIIIAGFFIFCQIFGGFVPVSHAASGSSNVTQNQKKLNEVQNKLKKAQKDAESYLKKSNEQKQKGADRQEEAKKLRQEYEKSKQEAAKYQREKESIEAAVKMEAGNFTGMLLNQFKLNATSSEYYGRAELRKKILVRHILMETASGLSLKYIEQEQAEKNATKINKSLKQIEYDRYLAQHDANKSKKESRKLDNQARQKQAEIAKLKKQEAALKTALNKLFKQIEAERRKAAAAKAASSKTSTAKTTTTQPRQTSSTASSASLSIAPHSLQWPAEGSILHHFSAGNQKVVVETARSMPIKSIIEGTVYVQDSLNLLTVWNEKKSLFTIYEYVNNISQKNGGKVQVGSILGYSSQIHTEGKYSYGITFYYMPGGAQEGKTLNPEIYLR